jgi:uncharacterized membrane protein
VKDGSHRRCKNRRVTLDDWILALHLLSAFALVAGMILFWVLFVPSAGPAGDATLAALSRVGSVAVIVGSVGTLVFGVWLAISLDAYQLWDGWVIAALVLWAISAETGRRAGEAAAAEERQRSLVFHAVSSLAILLLLIDMIWKPGA